MAVNVQGAQKQFTNTQDQQQQTAVVGGLPQFGISSRLATYGTGGEVFEKLFEKIQAKVKFLNDEVKTEEKYSVIKLLKQIIKLVWVGFLR